MFKVRNCAPIKLYHENKQNMETMFLLSHNIYIIIILYIICHAKNLLSHKYNIQMKCKQHDIDTELLPLVDKMQRRQWVRISNVP